MNVVLKYCLEEIGCPNEGIKVSHWDSSPVKTLLSIAEVHGKRHISGCSEIVNDEDFDETDAAQNYPLCEKWAEEHGLKLSRADEILCFEIPKCEKTESTAVRLDGTERDILFSDLPYLVTLGPVFGVIKDGAVVSLAGAVDRGTVYEVHIETTPKFRNKGFAKACLAALADIADKPILYRCRTENKASLATCSALGGRLLCRYRVFIARP